MALTKFAQNVDNIQGLSDRPNELDGLTPDQLKKKFDDASIDLKNYLNDTLTEEVDSLFNTIKGSYIETTCTGGANYATEISAWETGENSYALFKFTTSIDKNANAMIKINDEPYKEIINSNGSNVKGGFVENKPAFLLYKNGKFEIFSSGSETPTSYEASYDCVSINEYTNGAVIPFTKKNYDNSGDKVVFNANGSITINAKGYIKVAFNIWVYSVTTTFRPWARFKNLTTGAFTEQDITSGASNYFTLTSPGERRFKVNVGDSFGLTINANNPFKINAGSDSTASYLTIKWFPDEGE